MELREDYKYTEVGVVPVDWEVKSIKEVAPLQRGFDLPNREIRPGIYPVVYSNGIENYHNKYKAKGPGIITGRSGTMGRVTFVKEDYWPHNTALWVTNFLGNNPEYVFYLFINLRLERFATGSGVPTLNRNDVHDFRICIPSNVTEQTSISTALGDTDAMINSLEKLIAKKRNIKQGAMQQLLKPKKGWIVKSLGDFLEYEQPTEYLVSNTEYNDNNQIPVLTAGKTFILGFTNEEHGIFKNLPVIIFDDFTTAIKYVDFPFKAKSSAMKMLLPKNEEVNLRFVYEIMLQIKYQVADHKRHWIGEYSKIEIKVPSMPEEQTRIATILSDMDDEIQALETKLEKYRKIKLGMMQNLLTGKIRLV